MALSNKRDSNAEEESYVAPSLRYLSQPELDGNSLELNKLLSIGTTGSTTSPFAKYQAAAEQQATQSFRNIGAGSCGVVFALEGKSLALKLGKATDSDLWNDYLMHTLIRSSIQKHDITIKVPACYFYVPRDDPIYFQKHDALLEAAKDRCNLPTNILVTEQITPLPKPTRTHLIEEYCAEKGKEKALTDPANHDCLVRVYLGSLDGKTNRQFFSLRNFKLHLNHMIELRLDVAGMASEIAKALAIVHWDAKTDGRDVEFVLGSSTTKVPMAPKTYAELSAMKEPTFTGPESRFEEDFFRRETKLWLLDFNQVRRITLDSDGVAKAVDATMVNDPYFPKPLQSHPVAKAIWKIFADTYLQTSERILKDENEDVQRLPMAVIDGMVEVTRAKQQRKVGDNE